MQQPGIQFSRKLWVHRICISLGPNGWVVCLLWALVSSSTKSGKRYFCFGNCQVLCCCYQYYSETLILVQEKPIRFSESIVRKKEWWKSKQRKGKEKDWERKREEEHERKRERLKVVRKQSPPCAPGGNQEDSQWHWGLQPLGPSSHITGHLIQSQRNLLSLSCVLSTWFYGRCQRKVIRKSLILHIYLMRSILLPGKVT